MNKIKRKSKQKVHKSTRDYYAQRIAPPVGEFPEILDLEKIKRQTTYSVV